MKVFVKFQVQCRPAAMTFIFRSEGFNEIHVELNFQHNIYLHTTEFTPTVM
jgi:hypothetical protein